MDKVRVVIADDNADVRQKIKKLLLSETGVELVTEVGDGQGAINMARKEKPDVILMDANMPGTNGIWATQVILRELPQIKIIGLAVLEDEAEEMERAGASVCIFKNMLEEYWADVLHKVMEPGEEEGKAGNGQDEQVKDIRLTRRERDILACIAEGKNNRQIAETLSISEKTVKNHLTSIFRKLGVQDRTQAALYALKKGIV